jgi:hypothetical protein
MLNIGMREGYTDAQIDELLALPPGSTSAYRGRGELTQMSVPDIVAAAKANTAEGADYRDTLLNFAQKHSYTNDQMDVMLGLPAGSTAAYAAS